MAPRLRVVRFRGAIAREYHALAFCIPKDDSLVRVIYATHEVDCEAHLLIKAVDVNVQSMLTKAHIIAAVEHDYDAVRQKLPEYAQIFAEYDAQLAEVHASLASMTLGRRSRVNTESCPKTAAKDAIANFKMTCPADSMRLTTIASNVSHFKEDSQTLMPTSWVKTPPALEGMQSLDLSNKMTGRQVAQLCKLQKLKPPSVFVRNNSFHYGKYQGNKLTSLISLSVANLNRTPGSIAISIDLAASLDKQHTISIALKSIQKSMRKRRNKCVMFTQCAQTESARTFWAGKLTKTKRASVMTALLHGFDNRYQIYEDAEDMAIFFE